MAKEGFDWIWCEHALTIGYRSSLTEIVQIIGRATRDAEGKERARFTNLIAEPAAPRCQTSSLSDFPIVKVLYSNGRIAERCHAQLHTS